MIFPHFEFVKYTYVRILWSYVPCVKEAKALAH